MGLLSLRKNIFMQKPEFVCRDQAQDLKGQTFDASAPSNIALVKYWGKYDQQLPANTSISFTLNASKTETQLVFKAENTTNTFVFDVFFEGEKAEDFKPKIKSFFERIEAYVPFLKKYQLEIHTSNTFPHSSGIASSASGMAALAKAIMAAEASFSQPTEEYLQLKTSFLARLGSGSACRSTSGDLVVWGEHSDIPESSNFYGIHYNQALHVNFKNFQDYILLVDKGQKQVSSSVGHNLMHDHPFAEQRFAQANQHMTRMKTVLATGDYDQFFEILESEALSLHAMMLTSQPYFILMRPNTLQIIECIWRFRKETELPLGFTLDAGANVHLLFPTTVKAKVETFIEDELKQFCQNAEYIKDEINIE